MMKEIVVETGIRYPIYFQHPDILSEINAMPGKKILITDDHVKKLYAEKLAKQLHCDVLSMTPGDVNKTRETKAFLEDQMLSLGLMRDTCVIAMGGGVVCDMAGFVAATYCRGVPVVYIPTTLLAMVDASVGGKTGVNTSQGKNMIGTFTQPKSVFIDTHYLSTLSKDELKNGLVETIKHALIVDEQFFAWLQLCASDVLRMRPSVLQSLIYQSVEIKAKIVAEDEREHNGRRALLNCGHTYGHAIEIASGYQVSHGMAVAAGMIIEARIAIAQNLASQFLLDQLMALFDCYEIDVMSVLSAYPSDQLTRYLTLDKKRADGVNQYVAVHAIGSASLSALTLSS